MKNKCGCVKFTTFCLTEKARKNLIMLAKKEKISMSAVLKRIVENL